MEYLQIYLLLFALLLNKKVVLPSTINNPQSLTSQFNLNDLNSILNPPTFTEMAAAYGHSAEAHEVITEDGYILTLFHIQGEGTMAPVLLFHGLLDSSDTWLVRGNESLGINLANRNNDVWFGNVRGNRYSRRHTRLNPDTDAAFWDFTFDEHGLYDLPATIDYILNYTGANKLNMFGHSQGNTIIWVLLSTRTEYNDKINVATALAPICYLKHVLSPASILAQILPPLRVLFQRLKVTNVFGDGSLETLAARVISRIPVLGYLILAYGILFQAFGTDSSELESSFLPFAILHTPTWTSTKNLIHFSQLVVSGQFVRFDYGESGNLLAYNSSTPPSYQLQKITAKVVLLAARNDNLSQLVDVDKFRRQLPNIVRYIINPRLIMNHIDYIWGRTAPHYLFNYIFEVLEDYN